MFSFSCIKNNDKGIIFGISYLASSNAKALVNDSGFVLFNHINDSNDILFSFKALSIIDL